MNTKSRSSRGVLPLVAMSICILLCGGGCSLLKFFQQNPGTAVSDSQILETDAASKEPIGVVEVSDTPSTGQAVASDVAMSADVVPVVADDSSDSEEATKEDVLAAMAELRSVDPDKYASINETLDLSHNDPLIYAYMTSMIRAAVARAGHRPEIRTNVSDIEDPADTVTPSALGEMFSTRSRTQREKDVARINQPTDNSTAANISQPDTPSREAIALEMARMSASMNLGGTSSNSHDMMVRSFGMPDIDDVVRRASYDEEDPAPGLLRDSNLKSAMPADRPVDQSTAPTNEKTEPPSDWKTELDRSIEALEREVHANPLSKSPEMFRRHEKLRMLYALAGRRDDAIEPIVGLDEPSQQFWRNQIYGLTTWLDEEHMPNEMERAAAAKRYLSRAGDNLGELASLVVDNVCFCSDVKGRGVVDLFESSTFNVGQQVIIYAEIENFVGNNTPQGYLVKVRGSCQIFDSTGRMVDDYPPMDQERLFTSRHSKIHVIHNFVIPDLPRGHYKLRLRIEDAIGGKVNERELEFDVARR